MTVPARSADPACDSKGAIVIVYADGHVQTVAGARATSLWNQAVRLAAAPAADGAGPTAWQLDTGR